MFNIFDGCVRIASARTPPIPPLGAIARPAGVVLPDAVRGGPVRKRPTGRGLQRPAARVPAARRAVAVSGERGFRFQ